jgi:hypothetical protein
MAWRVRWQSAPTASTSLVSGPGSGARSVWEHRTVAPPDTPLQSGGAAASEGSKYKVSDGKFAVGCVYYHGITNPS